LALPDFEKAVEMEPYNVRGRYYLGTAFLEIGKHDGAVEHLEKGDTVVA
jgi:cytochrome c-type biogenesis protein CcmH/NrfG